MNNPRIITGKYKSRRLNVPSSARPVTDRVKTVLFDILGSHIQESNVLDLFAGSGNLGIEALSRGAEHCTFVESNSKAIEMIQKNVQLIQIPENDVSIEKKSYNTFLKNSEKSYDIIFIDPPFEKINHTNFALLENVMHKDSIAILKIESSESQGFVISESFEIIMRKSIGSNELLFFKLT